MVLAKQGCFGKGPWHSCQNEDPKKASEAELKQDFTKGKQLPTPLLVPPEVKLGNFSYPLTPSYSPVGFLPASLLTIQSCSQCTGGSASVCLLHNHPASTSLQDWGTITTSLHSLRKTAPYKYPPYKYPLLQHNFHSDLLDMSIWEPFLIGKKCVIISWDRNLLKYTLTSI